MLLLKIAFRNILRNRRRSALTTSAVAVGAAAMLMFGSFITFIFEGFQTSVVQQIGHLTVFHKGYFLFGAGNATAYGIDNYKEVMSAIANDPVLQPLINVVTPTQIIAGIAGNFEGGNDAAKTFFGFGLLPRDRDRMRQWNEFGAGRVFPNDSRLSQDDETRGLVGVGLARILALCDALKIENCPSPPAATQTGGNAHRLPRRNDVLELAGREGTDKAGESGQLPRLDLLSATANGAPNVVSLYVAGTDPKDTKEFDESFVVMHLNLAQKLVYGREEPKATSIVIQLKRSEYMERARSRLAELLKARHADLEIRDFIERSPFYGQALQLFRSLFLFIAAIMGVIVLFSIINTMTINVMERTSEIGTIRAMGARRRIIRRQFLAEGSLLGAIGATAGLLLATLVTLMVNHAGLSWIPPGNVSPNPLRLDLSGNLGLVVGTWIGLTLVATLATLIPAQRAARLPVVDALRHV